MIDTYTNANTDDLPELTVERLMAMHKSLQEMLPLVAYHTSPYAPIVDDEGEACMVWIQREAIGDMYFDDVPIEATYLVILHPDNLSEFQRRCKGHCRLTSLVKEPHP